MNLIRNACTFIGQGHLIIGVKKKMCHYHQLRGFAKLKKFQKSKNNLDRAHPTHPPPIQIFFFLETHQWHGQSTQITTFNNVQTEYITLRSYHMSTHSPHWK